MQGSRPQGGGDLMHTKKDQLEYVADLLLEMRDMARRHKLATLTGILDLAHTEARLRAKDEG